MQGSLLSDQKEQKAGAMRSLDASDALVTVLKGQIAELRTRMDVIPVS